MATPYVAALVALKIQTLIQNQLPIDPAQIKEILFNSATAFCHQKPIVNPKNFIN
jgi:hypothetical protein